LVVEALARNVYWLSTHVDAGRHMPERGARLKAAHAGIAGSSQLGHAARHKRGQSGNANAALLLGAWCRIDNEAALNDV
jgi:hypothetical protein